MGTRRRGTRHTGSVGLLVCVAALLGSGWWPGPRLAAQTDLDGFMREVLVRRDDNWKKLQQYVLDETERIELRGASRTPIWGERREYTWFLRDGFFVRSPVKFNGVTIGDGDRRKYEDEYLERVKRRDRRGAQPEPAQQASTVDGLIQQTRQPQFISSAYFLRFRFEEGTYAFVGRETIEGRDTLRVEYYPTRMFAGSDRRRNQRTTQAERDHDAEFQRMMNKVALITLWIEPDAHQIIKYTFDNVGFDFLPAQWLVQVDDLRASMMMSEPFPTVWLPRSLELTASMTLAVGPLDAQYSLDYHDYRRADVTSKVGGVQ